MDKNKKLYNEWSEIYDSNENKTRDLDLIATQETLSSLSYSRVLEIGCGTGKHTKWISPNTKKYYAMDFSGGMLAKLKTKVGGKHLEIVESDINKPWLAIENEEVGLVMTNLVLEHIEDLTLIFEEANRVLCTKGHFFISELHPFKQYIGSKARFDQADGSTQVLDCFVHHISEYLAVADQAKFSLIKLEEWFDKEEKKESVPRLVSFLFQKK